MLLPLPSGIIQVEDELTKEFHIGEQACFKLLPAIETSFARDLMSERNWRFFNCISCSTPALNERNKGDLATGFSPLGEDHLSPACLFRVYAIRLPWPNRG